MGLRETLEAATPGPWRWFGHRSSEMYLATPKGGRRFVMTFKRKGMRGAEPMFQVYTDRQGEPWGWNGELVPATDLAVQEVEYRDDIKDIDHPDARLIALAPELAALVLDMGDELAEIRTNVSLDFGDCGASTCQHPGCLFTRRYDALLARLDQLGKEQT